MFERKLTKKITVGGVEIGALSPVSVQSMCNTKTHDVEATVEQIKRLRAAGCDIVRLAIPDMAAAEAISEIKAETDMPLVADIHFDYRLALAVAERGIDKIRINPGNIGSEENVRKVAEACRKRNIPIRIGVNGGSLEKPLLEKYGHPCPEAMLESAKRHIKLLNKCDFDDICISMKSSSVPLTIAAYRLASGELSYPLHVGVTETGTAWNGTIQSAVGIGTLLSEGIGDTLRVSLTAAPEEEMTVAWELLRALGLRQRGPEIISCPTCGRTEIDLIGLAQEVERRLRTENAPIKVAVMGCVVNGPGEAREADLGMAGGRDKGIIFRKGEVIRSVRGQEALLAAFMEELDKLLVERRDL